MLGAKVLPLVDCEYLNAVLKGNDCLHVCKDAMKMSFESTVMAMATEMEMPFAISRGRPETTAEKDKYKEVH